MAPGTVTPQAATTAVRPAADIERRTAVGFRSLLTALLKRALPFQFPCLFEVLFGGRVAGVESKCRFKFHTRLSEVPLFSERHTEIEMGIDKSGPQANNFLELRDRF